MFRAKWTLIKYMYSQKVMPKVVRAMMHNSSDKTNGEITQCLKENQKIWRWCEVEERSAVPPLNWEVEDWAHCTWGSPAEGPLDAKSPPCPWQQMWPEWTSGSVKQHGGQLSSQRVKVSQRVHDFPAISEEWGITQRQFVVVNYLQWCETRLPSSRQIPTRQRWVFT